MQKTNFTSIRSLQFMFMSLLMIVGFNISAQTLACNDAIQVSVNNSPNICAIDLTADMLLEGDPVPGTNYHVRLTKNLTVVVPTTPGTIAAPLPVNVQNTAQYFGSTLVARVYAGNPNAGGNVNSCWVNVTIEDKLAPILTCNDVTIACTADADLDSNNDGLPNVATFTVNENCSTFNANQNISNVDIQLVDEVISTVNNCAGIGAAGFVTIVRTYIAIDEQGNTSAPCQQVITVVRPIQVDIPDDITWTCEQYATQADIIEPTILNVAITDTDAATPGIQVNPLLSVNILNNTGSGVIGGIFAPGVNAPANGDIAEEYCKYAYSHSDQPLSTCGYAAALTSPVFKIVRTWTVLDWCTGSIATNLNPLDGDAVQVIKVTDNTPPLVVGADVTISANIQGQHPQPCKGQGPFLMGTATDNCTGPATNLQGFVYSSIALNSAVAQVTSVGNGFGVLNPALPVGCYFVVWSATDACGNSGQSTAYQLCVEDNIVPVAVCDEITQVALSSDGLAVVYAGTFDDGSYDNCCLDRLEVRRMGQTCGITGNTTFDSDGHPQDSPSDPDNGEFVTFCCSDIGNTNMVVLRVFDCSNNYNECMVEVLVEDKLAPIITCPPNATINCDNYADQLAGNLLACTPNGVYTPLSAAVGTEDDCQSTALENANYGTAIAFDNCAPIIDVRVTVNLNQCTEGTIIREFIVSDASENGTVSFPNGFVGNTASTCRQTITVTHVSDWVVEFPADVTEECLGDEPDFGQPEIFFETCELIATSFEDQVFNIVPDACFKITRQWTVINWCVVGDEIDQQVIETPESGLPGLCIPSQRNLNGVNNCNDRTFQDGLNSTNVNYAAPLKGATPDGYITYQQVIKVIDNEAPEIVEPFTVGNVCIITGNNGTNNDFSGCVYNGVLPTPTYSDCIIDVNDEMTGENNGIANAVIVTARVFDAAGNIVSNSVIVNNLAIGSYTVRYTAIDRCGNTTVDVYPFDVDDCKLPTPYCKDGVVLELMAINDPNNTTFVPMVELWASDLDLGSFDNCAGAVKLSFSEDVNDIGRQYTCDNVGQNEVSLYVTDANDNVDFCTTFVIIQANQGQCPVDPGSNPLVAGSISNEQNASVENVTVQMSGQSNGMSMTTVDGNYSFNVPTGSDVTITPSKDDNHDNGVSTFDLVVISKHILGTQTLGSPYKMIAADANNSGTITTLDLVQIRKLILHIDTEFSNNTSWRFINKDFSFTNPNNPWATSFPEVININNIAADQLATDFVAVKIGDVNGSATTNNNLLGADDRSAGKLVIAANDRMVKAGETVTVDFTTVEAVEGYQFTMNFSNALDFVTLNEGTAAEENFGFAMLNERAITASWNGNAAANAAAFSMTFTANADVLLSEALNINSRYTAAEAYNNNNELLNVELNFNADAVSTFELYQNTPNPFNGETTIGFNMAEEGAATLTITDMSGRVLTVIKGNYAKGYNQEVVNNLPATGVMYYTLATANETATKKMVATK